jgi:hypothetical protein
MARIDRREKTALDNAYRYFKEVVREDRSPDLYKLANCLKTVSNALKTPQTAEFKLTTRLWRRIQETLLDKMLGSFPTHVIVLSDQGNALEIKEHIPEDALVEVHPQGLRRADDAFRLEIKNFPPLTRTRLKKIWKEKSGAARPEDFATVDCGGVCPVTGFLVGEEILQNESELGKQRAYQKWWELYWQAYCSNDKQERAVIEKEMLDLEGVWGNLYY